MNGFHNEEQFKIIIGNRLSQVCIGENETILRFDDGASYITIMSEFYEKNKNFINFDSIDSTFQRIIGRVIEDVNIISDNILEIKFENNLYIYISDDDDRYESVVFHINGHEIIV